MDGAARLAKMLKERDNFPYMGPQIGVVISPLPKVQIGLGDKIILNKRQLIFAANCIADLKSDDEVILIPSTDAQTYFVIDKVVGL